MFHMNVPHWLTSARAVYVTLLFDLWEQELAFRFCTGRCTGRVPFQKCDTPGVLLSPAGIEPIRAKHCPACCHSPGGRVTRWLLKTAFCARISALHGTQWERDDAGGYATIYHVLSYYIKPVASPAFGRRRYFLKGIWSIEHQII